MFEAIKAHTRAWGLGRRVLTLTTLTVLVAVAVNYLVVVNAFRQSSEQAMFEKAAAFTAVADEAPGVELVGTLIFQEPEPEAPKPRRIKPADPARLSRLPTPPHR